MVREQSVKYVAMSSSTDVVNTIRPLLENSAVERLVAVGLDTRNHPTVISIQTGATDWCAAAPSTILKIMLLSNAVGMILVHNHPGNTMQPSECDWKFTHKMKAACEAVDIKMLDSIIVNADCSENVSMRSMSRWNQ
jgi:DNA repair protein RadC